MIGENLNLNLKVKVINVSSIDDFYVMKEPDLENFQQIQRLLNKITIGNAQEIVSDADRNLSINLQSIKPGDLVAARRRESAQFYRGRVLAKSIELDDSLGEVEVVSIFFIDLGDVFSLQFNDIKILSSSLQALPPLALKCSLFDCLSLGDSTSETFANLVGGQHFLMEIMEKVDDNFVVDLIQEMDDDIKFTSIRDVLVLSGTAVFYTCPFVGIPNVENERKFKELPALEVGTTRTVLLSHMHRLTSNSLPQVSVQLVSDEKLALKLPSLMEEMKVVYNAKRSEELWGLTGFWPGMVCAVKDPRDKMWYRGKVLGTVKGRLLLVNYVDFGNSEQVSFHRLRRLFTDFMELPALAMRVCIGACVPNVDVYAKLKEELSSGDLDMRVLEKGCPEYLPTVDLALEGQSVCEWLTNFIK